MSGSCDICRTDGACICTRSIPDRVAYLRYELARLADELRAVEADLAAELARRGSRPGDGSDQPRLFSCDHPSLFGG